MDRLNQILPILSLQPNAETEPTNSTFLHLPNTGMELTRSTGMEPWHSIPFGLKLNTPLVYCNSLFAITKWRLRGDLYTPVRDNDKSCLLKLNRVAFYQCIVLPFPQTTRPASFSMTPISPNRCLAAVEFWSRHGGYVNLWLGIHCRDLLVFVWCALEWFFLTHYFLWGLM